MQSEKPKLLSISLAVTLKNNIHAGGKINYYYIAKLLDKYDITFINRFSIREMSLFEEKKLENVRYIRTNDYKPSFFVKCMNKFLRLTGLDDKAVFWKCLDKYGFISRINELRNEGYEPEIVILDWTQCIYFSKYVKKAFPKAKVIGFEQDVTFQNFKRRISLQTSEKEIRKAEKEYRRIRKVEMKSIQLLDQLDVLTEKDAVLLKEFKGPIKVVPPYFSDFSGTERKPVNKNIIYYGDMSRKENYESVIWFMENVFQKLPSDFIFTIIGGNPSPLLEKYRSERVILTGFVDDVGEYFGKAMSLIAPLTYGAGIKIKILEAMSAGVPVITNAIGIEGIPAENGKDYIHCEAPEDYVKAIINLSENEKLQKDISENCKQLIENNFDYKNSSYI